MPSYNFVCKTDGAFTRITLKPWKRLLWTQVEFLEKCPKCGEKAERAPNPPGSTVKETLDNGAMRRKVERFRDAERLYKDRAKGGPK